jgi:hypothetical protein
MVLKGTSDSSFTDTNYFSRPIYTRTIPTLVALSRGQVFKPVSKYIQHQEKARVAETGSMPSAMTVDTQDVFGGRSGNGDCELAASDVEPEWIYNYAPGIWGCESPEKYVTGGVPSGRGRR